MNNSQLIYSDCSEDLNLYKWINEYKHQNMVRVIFLSETMVHDAEQIIDWIGI